MTSALFGKSGEKILSGTVDILTDDIKAAIVDMDDDGTAITNATNATPIVVTSTGHGMSSGQRVMQLGVGGNTAANGVFLVTVTDANTYSLQDLSGNDVAGNGAYTSGGLSLAVDVFEFIDEITGVIANSGNMTGKTVALGVVDVDDFTVNSVTGDPSELVIFYKDTGTPATSPVLAAVEGSLVADGNNVNVTIDVGGAFAIC